MDFSKKYNEIVSNLDYSSFDSMNEGFENFLDLLEIMQSTRNVNEQFLLEVMNKSEELKKESIRLLSNQQKEIFSMAKASGISLTDLGITFDEPKFE